MLSRRTIVAGGEQRGCRRQIHRRHDDLLWLRSLPSLACPVLSRLDAKPAVPEDQETWIAALADQSARAVDTHSRQPECCITTATGRDADLSQARSGLWRGLADTASQRRRSSPGLRQAADRWNAAPPKEHRMFVSTWSAGAASCAWHRTGRNPWFQAATLPPTGHAGGSRRRGNMSGWVMWAARGASSITPGAGEGFDESSAGVDGGRREVWACLGQRCTGSLTSTRGRQPGRSRVVA
jgi:hypothetical protein